jgi:DNA modification methylase
VGIEATPEEFIAKLVEVFAEVRRVLRDDGALWLNLGDKMQKGQLLGLPWRVALALQADGWLLRSEVIWGKRNGLPDGSATDRPDRFHEQIFLLTKQRHYYYDAEAVREQSDPAQEAHNRRYAREYKGHSERVATTGQPGNVNNRGIHSRPGRGGRNKRSVWWESVARFPGAHFAVMPQRVVLPCVLAGSKPGDTVLDPFCGAGTTGLVAQENGRAFIGIELNPETVALAEDRLAQGTLVAAAVQPQDHTSTDEGGR